MTRDELVKRSIEIIRENQCHSGAYLASPAFPVYHYSWFRDGAYIAHAMDRVGRSESAAAFHNWAAKTVVSRRESVERVTKAVAAGAEIDERDLLHTRYRADGSAGEETWENFQLDGFGTWLWALADHSARRGAVTDLWTDAADLVARYLTSLWNRACYDLWEEHPFDVHTYTLASTWAGLRHAESLGITPPPGTLEAIAERISEHHTIDAPPATRRFVKSTGSADVDASLLALAAPYALVGPEDARFAATIATIKARLMGGGGLHLYPQDSYYGGGAWILLTAWLSWVESLRGNPAEAQSALTWVEAQATSDGSLPEQVPLALNVPEQFQPWQRKLGPVATPLLWSHAMYLIAVDEASER